MSQSLEKTLQAIVNEVQIESEAIQIHHPIFKTPKPPPEVVGRFQKLPKMLRQKYLGLKLSSFLYGIYYNGSLRTILAQYEDATDLSLSQELENTTFLGVDVDFYERLHASNRGAGYFEPGWRIVAQEKDGSLAVMQGGLTLHIDRDRHLQNGTKRAEVGDLVDVRFPKNRVQNGFYIAIGNAGASYIYSKTPEAQDPICRIYFNLRAEGAIAVMESLTQQINSTALPFSFKVLYNPDNYKRYDSGVFYFAKSDYPVVRSVLQQIYAEHQSYFEPDVPLFTKPLAPGLAIAEEPSQAFAQQESFGMNRCQIISHGLLEAHQSGDECPENRIAVILKHFSLLNINVNYPYLNPASEDIYTALESV